MKRIIILVAFSIIALSFNACVHLTEKAFLDFQNDSSSQIMVSTKINKEEEYSEDFTLDPGKSELFYMYEETPGKEETIFDSFNQVRVTNAEGCAITLGRSDVKELATRSEEGNRWTIHVSDELFSASACE